ncbi:MAG: hypothetical protein KDC44_00285, partial [Phaeodactylibacter sp.]|nr:hypothetical protein [Phaeodactylibacter sp.]
MNTNNLLKAFTLFTMLVCSTLLSAQDIEVTDGATDPYTPENLITNIFLGDGVEVINVTFTGGANAVG